MMFDTLVGAEAACCSGDLEGDDDIDEHYLFKSSSNSMEMSTDLLMEYLKPYHQFRDGMESATDPDLSWDEGDLPNNRLIQVWSFNDFMDQYNQIYAWLNNIQVQYHDGKKKEGSSPRVEGYLKELEKDIHKRERFLRESGRMVGVYPELEGEVVWRMEHLMAKWDMLASLRNKARTKTTTDLPDVYSDIELEVRCLRKWLREMEARIDPLQFSKAQQWTTRDREKKMMEYQVLQTDIESHGRIVKLVLSLCEDLGQNPGQYDLPHALKVAKALERRWHQIWLRSLEWQCLLEQWLQYPAINAAAITPTNQLSPLGDGFASFGGVKDVMALPLADTDEEEPVNKVRRMAGEGRRADGIPRLVDLFASPTFSPAATLLRVKKRKRMLTAGAATDSQAVNTASGGDQSPSAERKISPRARRRLTSQDSGAAVFTSGSDTASQSEEDECVVDGRVIKHYVAKHYDSMNTSEDATNSDETPRLNLEDTRTVMERVGSIETPRTVIDGPVSANLLSMLAKLEAAEAKEMERRATDNIKITAPITFCEISETEGEDCLSTSSYRFSKSGQHSIEYTREFHREATGNNDICGKRKNSSLDNRRGSESNLERFLHENDLNSTILSWSAGSVGPVMHSTPVLEQSNMDVCGGRQDYHGKEYPRDQELVSLDSLEITSSCSSNFGRQNRKFTGVTHDSLEDVSSIVCSKSSIHSSQGISLESLSSEELAYACNLPSFQLDAEVDTQPANVLGRDCPQPSEIKQLSSKGKKKKRKRTNLSCLDESQSDIEMESYCNQLTLSRDQLRAVAKPSQDGDYDVVVESCAQNIQFLKELLSSWKEENSFISKKKSRETRMLLNDWNCLLERINCQVQVKAAVDTIQARTDSVRDRLLALLPSEKESRLADSTTTSSDLFRNQDILTVALYKYKDEMITLDQCKTDLADLNLQLHNIKAKLETSGGQIMNQFDLQMDCPVSREVETAQQKISDVYNLWERCHHSTTRNISSAEETLEKFKQFEHELTTLKRGLRKDALRYRGRKSALRAALKNGEGSCDSGISDASSTDNDFPQEREQQLARLRNLATHLEATLHPDSCMSSLISQTLESTSIQLRDLKLSFQRLKSTKAKRKNAGNNLSAVVKRSAILMTSSTTSTTAPLSTSKAPSRRRRVCRAALVLNLLLMGLLILAAVIHPRCCDAPGILSMLPQLKYTNGPPPI